MTYQHGLPFNQRVERKDKVKPSSLGTANQTDFTAKPCKGRQESETRNRFAIKQIASSEEKKKRGGRVKNGVRERRGQTWAKWLLNAFQICPETCGALLYHVSDSVGVSQDPSR